MAALSMLRNQIPFSSFLATAAVLGLCGASCDLDDRTLQSAPLGGAGEGGEDGSPDASDAGAISSSTGGSATIGSTSASTTAGASTTGSGGANTATSSGAPPLPSTNADCPDLDQNGVDDCEETLANNAGFEANAENWEAQAPVEFTWQAAGSTGGESGSVGVVLTSTSDKRTMAGVSQCVEIEASSRYLIYAQTLIREEESSAALSVFFYATSDCSEASIDGANSTMLSASDRWGVLHMSELAPAGTQSMAVRLGVVKEATVESVEVRFDNVLVRAE